MCRNTHVKVCFKSSLIRLRSLSLPYDQDLHLCNIESRKPELKRHRVWYSTLYIDMYLLRKNSWLVSFIFAWNQCLSINTETSLFQAPRESGPLTWESANTKIKREETGDSRAGGASLYVLSPFLFLFPAPPTFRVPFSFASSPPSESLEQAIQKPISKKQWKKKIKSSWLSENVHY